MYNSVLDSQSIGWSVGWLDGQSDGRAAALVGAHAATRRPPISGDHTELATELFRRTLRALRVGARLELGDGERSFITHLAKMKGKFSLATRAAVVGVYNTPRLDLRVSVRPPSSSFQ